jgi:glycosyltransferase involved in cell wall biosynthesis
LIDLHATVHLSPAIVAIYDYEIIFVDDGSVDGTWEMIKEFGKANQSIKGIRLSRNFGHHIALTAGLDLAIGK